MKKYLYVFRGGDEGYADQSPEQMQAHMQRWGEWMQKVKAEGYPLQQEGKVVGPGGKIVTDGPFTEGKEIVGGYVHLDAKDLDHAVELSKDCPIFEFGGTTEVREIITEMGM
ncbi:YciI family protein [Ekhidna sp.]|uniref:YciI family protein n=1 Tax=Ekhidna sp. TaxID=2608089 RepID=UPI003BA9CC8D